MEKQRSFIVVVDDEPDIQQLISFHLQKENYRVKVFAEGDSLFNFLKTGKDIPDLIILDIMLPVLDGYGICLQLKKTKAFSDIPIIMLSAKGEVIDKVVGLELGADDYLAKPFEPKELIARIKAVMRRKLISNQDEKGITVIKNVLVINPEKYMVTIDGEVVDLTTTEFKILELLANNPGRVFSREKLLDYLWGDEKWVIDRTIDVHIRNLRKKLGKYSELIRNIRGVGYKIVE